MFDVDLLQPHDNLLMNEFQGCLDRKLLFKTLIQEAFADPGIISSLEIVLLGL